MTITPLTTEQLDTIETRATSKHLTPGPWTLERESCDCGGDYPCGHGMYVTGVTAPTPTEIAAERLQRTGEQPRDYDFHRSEIGDFTEADWELMVHAREDVPALVAEVRRLRAQLATDPLPGGFRRDVVFAACCAVCEYEFDEDEAYTVHFNSVEQAHKVLNDHGWTVLADGRVVCDSDELDHKGLREDAARPAPAAGS